MQLQSVVYIVNDAAAMEATDSTQKLTHDSARILFLFIRSQHEARNRACHATKETKLRCRVHIMALFG